MSVVPGRRHGGRGSSPVQVEKKKRGRLVLLWKDQTEKMGWF